MYDSNYSDKESFKLRFLHNFIALILVIAVLVLWSWGSRSRPKIVSSLVSDQPYRKQVILSETYASFETEYCT